MTPLPKESPVNKSVRQDDYDPSDIAQKSQQEGPAAYSPHNNSEKKGQGIVRDERGQEQPADKKRAQQTSKAEMPQVSQSGQASGYSTSGEKKKGEA